MTRMEAELPVRLGLPEPSALGRPGMTGPAVEAEAMRFDLAVTEGTAEEERQRHQKAGARVGPPDRAGGETLPRRLVVALGQDVDGSAEGSQPSHRFAGPAHLFGPVVLGEQPRKGQDEGVRMPDHRAIQEVRIGEPFAHLPAAIDQGKVGDPRAGAAPETRRVVEAHDVRRPVNRGGGMEPWGVANDGDGARSRDRQVEHVRGVDLGVRLRQGFAEQQRYGTGPSRQRPCG